MTQQEQGDMRSEPATFTGDNTARGFWLPYIRFMKENACREKLLPENGKVVTKSPDQAGAG